MRSMREIEAQREFAREQEKPQAVQTDPEAERLARLRQNAAKHQADAQRAEKIFDSFDAPQWERDEIRILVASGAYSSEQINSGIAYSAEIVKFRNQSSYKWRRANGGL